MKRSQRATGCVQRRFWRIEDDRVITMGTELLGFLQYGESQDRLVHRVGEIQVTAPLQRPGKILCIGLSYRDHALETGEAIPERQIVFAKFANSVIGHGELIRVPRVAGHNDYEAELGVVTGKRCHDVPVEEALGSVAGCICLNGVSSRQLQFETGQWTRGKVIDIFPPMGLWMLTADEVSDPQSFAVRCSVNGEVRQDSSTKEMIFVVAELVSFLSQAITLGAADIVATGTPPGADMALDSLRWLGPGDVVTVEIDGLGTLESTVSVLWERRPTTGELEHRSRYRLPRFLHRNRSRAGRCRVFRTQQAAVVCVA